MSSTQTPVERTADVHVTGRRVVATLIDNALLGGLYVLIALAFGSIIELGGTPRWAIPTLTTEMTVILVAVSALYYILMEGYLGQTGGKMLAGIRVVGERSGRPPGAAAATVRTVFRVVDGLFGYLVAFIVVLASPRRQRLGDMAAHTLVVRT
ncbi:RDD family protein [Pseudonocardia bannensis]|uniref:RDD family protein n=1 Tax=Pseudonocardia bannensis TaxID=630973 RepID=A0A848DJL8_9PSEU|nr:RDD family protein [Pseudonocardia bannensis]NMH92671.1 RDD family protein [Pseudonocardia bannensis]